MAKARRKSRFLPFLLLYALLLALLGAGALVMLSRYLTVFERTRPAAAMEEYMTSLRSGGSEAACKAALKPLGIRIQSEGEQMDFVRVLLQDAQWRQSGDGDEERLTVLLSSGGTPLGTLTLRHSGEETMGLRPYAVTEEHFDFSPWLCGDGIVAPEGYRVYAGGRLLTEDSVTERDIPYACLADFYGQYEDLPHLLRYETGPCLGQPSLRMEDPQGRDVPPEEQNELRYLDNCDNSTRQALEDFARLFVTRYVAFTAAVEQDFNDSYGSLAQLLLPGSPLHQRLSRAAYDQWWSNTHSCTVESCQVHLVSDLGQGRYLVDLSYVTRTVAIGEPVVEGYSIRLVAEETYGGLRAASLYNY